MPQAQVQRSPSSSPPLTLSRHFPKEVAACKKVTDTFFACFLAKGMQPKGVLDAEAGANGLKACETSLKAYNDCLDGAMQGQKTIDYRVPEAYRVRKTPQ